MVKVIVGTMGRSPFAHVEGLSTKEDFSAYLARCEEHGIKELDTAGIYGGGENERILGTLDASKRFTVDTKILTSGEGSLSRDNVMKSIQNSLERLNVDTLDLLYIHRPDPSTPIEETLAAFHEAHQAGKFRQFGICHYSAKEVEEIVTLCEQKSYIKPSVYQGAYNPVSRVSEKELLPTLRKHGIHYYAFGPLASGLLAKSMEQLRGSQENARFGSLPIAKDAYLNEKMLTAVEKLHVACQAEGVSVMNATLRWMQFHSALKEEDGFLLGASSTDQLKKNLEGLAGGPLSDNLVADFETLWSAVQA
jgi:aflatoxin B1 aldehyde reductase